MNTYLAKTTHEEILAVRAGTEDQAKEFIEATGADVKEVFSVLPSVADAMKIPNAEGVYPDAVWTWLKTPSNFLGESIPNRDSTPL